MGGGSKLRRVAKTLIPIDVSHLSNNQEWRRNENSVVSEREKRRRISLVLSRDNPMAVSYTHLTLPTKRIV